ncbi:MAG: hypothetical protein J2P57_05085 [Acidimicrobiaceae bacterium]|nr:hypothetical protein [Acidimicrobiaceae bacterium]
MNILVAGIMGRHPYGGVSWCSLMYLLGLQRLGHRVWYIEDTGETNFDPVANMRAAEPSYALGSIQRTLEPHGLGDRWCYIDCFGKFHGLGETEWRRVCKDADLLVNLSGGCWFWRDEYASIERCVYVDSDPAFTQLAIATGPDWYRHFFERFDVLFTFGANIGTPGSPVPVGDFAWEHTWQPVSLQEWAGTPPDRSDPRLTTVMTWQIESFADIGGNKEGEFGLIGDLPGRVGIPLELAINAPDHVLVDLAQRGWRVRSAFEASSDVDVYRRYLQAASGELSVAKSTYVRNRSGWFSDRTECFLAAGRPAVVQDTGWSQHLPTRRGLFAFDDTEGACAAVDELLTRPEAHRTAASELAREYFADDVVLPALLSRAMVDP